MTEESEAKTCKMCSMEIPATARKCPYCHQWQHWFALQNPQTVVLLIVIPLLTSYFVLMGTIVRSPFRQWEQFREYSQQIKIIESKMEFGEDECGPDVIVVGKIENRSSVDWKDIRFQVDFFNPQGEVFDTGQQEAYTWRLPAEQEIHFKISFCRQFPEKEYATHKVRVVSAVDSRQWP